MSFAQLKLLFIGLAIGLLLAGGGIVGWLLHRTLAPAPQTEAQLLTNLPIAELAVREIKWKVMIHQERRFPASEYILSKIATIKVGFDLARLDESAIHIDAGQKKIIVNLPEPEVFSIEWSPARVWLDKHSLASAALTKPSEAEAERSELFRAGLLADSENDGIFDAQNLTEALERFVAPLFAPRGYRVEFRPAGTASFRDALGRYLNGTKQP